MLIHQVCADIQNRHKNGESYQAIADSLGITKAMCYQITLGYKPGPRVAAILKLDPSPKLKYTRMRQARLNEIARSYGYKSWSSFGTETIKKGEIKP